MLPLMIITKEINLINKIIIYFFLQIIIAGGFMKEGLIVGMALGFLVGAVMYKNSPEVKEMVAKGEKQVKKSLNKIKEKI